MPSVLLRRGHGRAPVRDRGTFRHHRGAPRDRIGEIEVADTRDKGSLVWRAAECRKPLDVGGVARRDLATAPRSNE